MRSVTATHRAQHPIAAGLHGQVDPLTKIFMLINRRHNVPVKVAWERRREFDALRSSRGHRAQQATEWRGALGSFQTAFGFRTITIHVLADKVNLFVAVPTKFVYLGNDV